MNKLFITLATIVALCLPLAASAGQQATKTKTENGWSHVICSLESSTGICDNNGTPDIYAIVDMYDTVTFTLIDAGTSTSICQIYAGTVFDAVPSTADISSLGGTKINSVNLSDSQQRIEFSNLSYKYLWVGCTTADASSTVIMQGSVGLNRIGR